MKVPQNCDGSIQHILNLSRKYLSDDQLIFFESQLKINKRTDKGKRWAVSDKLFGLPILFHSTQTSNNLRTIFCLPSRTTLLLFLSRVFGEPNTGFAPQVFSLLNLRAEAMDPHDRNISLVMDEMSLKQHLDYARNLDLGHGIKNGKPLNQALVFMARGLATKCKQPIAYFHNNSTVSTSDMSALLREAVTKINEVLVCIYDVSGCY